MPSLSVVQKSAQCWWASSLLGRPLPPGDTAATRGPLPPGWGGREPPGSQHQQQRLQQPCRPPAHTQGEKEPSAGRQDGATEKDRYGIYHHLPMLTENVIALIAVDFLRLYTMRLYPWLRIRCIFCRIRVGLIGKFKPGSKSNMG